jgi:hypothetical protein
MVAKSKVSFSGVDCAVCDEDIDSGLVMNVLMDEGSGGIAHDTTSYGNNGTCYDSLGTKDCTWATGKQDYGISFDGADDYINVSNSSSLNTGMITLEAWIKSDADGYIISREPVE